LPALVSARAERVIKEKERSMTESILSRRHFNRGYLRGKQRIIRAGETINIPANAPHQFRQIPNGHDNPLNFDVDSFAKCLGA
jgi:hypothetical protein